MATQTGWGIGYGSNGPKQTYTDKNTEIERTRSVIQNRQKQGLDLSSQFAHYKNLTGQEYTPLASTPKPTAVTKPAQTVQNAPQTQQYQYKTAPTNTPTPQPQNNFQPRQTDIHFAGLMYYDNNGKLQKGSEFLNQDQIMDLASKQYQMSKISSEISRLEKAGAPEQVIDKLASEFYAIQYGMVRDYKLAGRSTPAYSNFSYANNRMDYDAGRLYTGSSLGSDGKDYIDINQMLGNSNITPVEQDKQAGNTYQVSRLKELMAAYGLFKG